MKTFITFLFVLLCCTGIRLAAQTNYYTETKTFHEDGYTYQCDVNEAAMVSLYNADCTYYKTKQIDLTTGKAYRYIPGLSPLEREARTKPQCFAIVNRAFPPEIKARVNGRELMIILYIEPTTGKIADVVFEFTTDNLAEIYTQVPVSVYREIEVELKENVRFTPSALGKKLNYIFMFWTQDPNVTVKSDPLTPIEPTDPDPSVDDSVIDDSGQITTNSLDVEEEVEEDEEE